MRRALVAVTLAVLAAPAVRAKDAKPGVTPGIDYVALSRALTEVDAAERRGDLGDDLRWAQAADADPEDLATKFLSVSAQPELDLRWEGYHQLSEEFPRSPLPWLGMARVY